MIKKLFLKAPIIIPNKHIMAEHERACHQRYFTFT